MVELEEVEEGVESRRFKPVVPSGEGLGPGEDLGSDAPIRGLLVR